MTISPDSELRAEIEFEYRRSEFLFYGPFPELGEVYRRLEGFCHCL